MKDKLILTLVMFSLIFSVPTLLSFDEIKFYDSNNELRGYDNGIVCYYKQELVSFSYCDEPNICYLECKNRW